MSYSVTLPDGRNVEFPDDVSKEKAASIIQEQFPEFALKTTVAGNIKEGFKGVIPGAVNMVQSAVTGAAAILPDEQEQSVRETTRSIADAVRKPFEAAPGYEQSPGRKLGEGVGSTAPFFALGPLGVAGKAAAGAMGTAAGAGEARVRAEQDGASDDQRGLSTMLGAGVGATEILPVFHFLNKLSTPVREGVLNYVRRAAVTGGVEGAQEAAAQALQNLIAKGVYKPDQAIIEDVGESGAYGAGVGAIIQGLTDMALGRRGAKGQVVDGESAIDKARAGAPPEPVAPTEDKPAPEGYGELKQYEQSLIERFKAGERSPELKEELKRVKAQLVQITAEDYQRRIPQTNPDLLTAEEAGQPDLFGEYVPEREVAPTEEIPEPTVRADSRQKQLPFVDEAQGALFEELPPSEVDQDSLVTEKVRDLDAPMLVGHDQLAALGVPRQSAFMKKLLNEQAQFRLDRTSDVNKLITALDNILTKSSSPAVIKKVEPFINYLKRQQLELFETQGDADAAENNSGNDPAPVTPDSPPSSGSVAVSGDGIGVPTTRGIKKPVVPRVAPPSGPVSPDVRGTQGAQPALTLDAVTEKPAPKKSEYEPPLVVGLTPAKEAELRSKLAEQKAATKQLEKARDDAEERMQIAEFTGNEFERLSAEAELAEANKEFYRAAKRAEGTYYRLFDKAKSEFEGAVGEAYIDDYQDDKAKRKAIATGKAPAPPKFPYNITDLNTLNEEIEYSVPKTLPEYQAYRAKYFTKPGKLKNSVREEDAVKAGQEVLSRIEMKLDTPATPTTAEKMPIEEQKRIAKLLQGKSLMDVVKYVRDTSKVPGHTQIAERVIVRLQQMQNLGVKFNFKIVNVGDMAPRAFVGSQGLAVFSFGDKAQADVYVRGPEEFSVGLSPVTLLHEAVHAVTNSAINVGNKRAAMGTEVQKAVAQLYDVTNTVIKEFNNRIKNTPAEQLTPFERKVYAGNNALQNPDEVLSWTLTDPEMQQWMESVPYKNTNLWTRFVEVMRSVFGLSAKQDTALSEVLRIADTLFDTDVNELQDITKKAGSSLTPLSNALVNSPNNERVTTDADIVAIRKDPTLSENVKSILTGGSVRKVRTLLTDRMASLDKKLWDGYGQQIRDKFGNTNPSLLLAQALDFQRIAEAVLKTGGLKKTPDGMYTATTITTPNDPRFKFTAGQPVSGEKVVEYINSLAQAEGKSYEDTVKTLSTLLYGHREAELLKHNQQVEATARALEAAGKKPEAQRLRDNNVVSLALSTRQITDVEAAYQNTPEAQIVLEMMDAVRFNLIDNLVESGRITPDRADDWKEASGYVPFDRLSDIEETLPKSSGRSRGLQGVAAFRKLKGGERQVDDIVSSFLAQSSRMVGDAVRVNAVRRSLQDLELLGYAKQAPAGTKPSPETKNNYVKTYIDGNLVEFYVQDPLDVAAFAGMPTEVSTVISTMQKAAGVLRAGVTLMPGFAFSQVAQDIVRAYAFSGVQNPAMLIPRILRGFPKAALGELKGKKSVLVRELENLGIIGSYDTTHTSTVENVMRESGVTKRNPFEQLLHIGESLSKASDLAVRQAIYEQTMQETGGDQLLAQQRAREIINFSRRGNARSLDILIRTIPFFNAYLRGMDKLYTAATGEGGATGLTVKQARNDFMKRMTILTGIGTVYALMMVGDDDYEAQPQYVRDANWVFPGGEYLGYTPSVPLPKDLGIIFKAIPERIVSYFKYQGTSEERDGVQILGQLAKYGLIDVVASPNTVPVALRPLLENLTNYSFFLGRPLESQSQVTMDANERKNASTSESMQGLSDVLFSLGISFSPIKLENLYRGILGSAGALSLSMMDAAVNPTRTDRPLHKDMLAQMTGASTFMKDAIGKNQIDELYKLNEKTLAATATHRKLEQENPEEAAAYFEKNYPMIMFNDIVRSKLDAINDLRKMAAMIDKQESVPPSERRKQIDEILVGQNELAQDIYVIRNEINKLQKEVD